LKRLDNYKFISTIVVNFKTIVMLKLFRIYSLSHPITKEIGYIGATTLLLNVRYSQHKHNALTKNLDRKVYIWFREIVAEGLLPEIKWIDTGTEDNWKEKETFWIEKYKKANNVSKGGSGIVLNRTSESKQRTIDAHKKVVVLLDKKFKLLEEFSSLRELAKFLNVGITAISNALNIKGTNSVQGYIVLFKEDFLSGNFIKEYKGTYKDIYQYSLNGEFIKKFPKVVDALREVNPCKYSSGLYEAADRNGTCGKYYWSFEYSNNLLLMKSNYKI